MKNDFVELAKNSPVEAMLELAIRINRIEAQLIDMQPQQAADKDNEAKPE